MNPHTSPAAPGASGTGLREAMELLRQGRYGDAERRLSSLADRHPDDPAVHRGLALLAAQTARTDLALRHMEAAKVITIVVFSLIGIAGSYGVAWFGIRVNTFANSRTAFAALKGKPFPCYSIPLKAGMSMNDWNTMPMPTRRAFCGEAIWTIRPST